MYLYDTFLPLFSEFYIKLARMKLQAEGWPKDCITEEQKEEYVKQLNEDMPGLGLQKHLVKKNPAVREFAKSTSNIGEPNHNFDI